MQKLKDSGYLEKERLNITKGGMDTNEKIEELVRKGILNDQRTHEDAI